MNKHNIYIELLSTNLEERQKYYKKILFIVSLSQVFGGAGLAAGLTVGALIAKDILGTDAYTGIPTALFTFGSAGAAYLVGLFSQKYGRRIGLSFGFALGGLGAIGVIISAITENIWLLFISLLIYGSGSASNLQARYAGTDLAQPKQRGKAISTTMVMTTFGAVLGPNLAEATGNFAKLINLPPLSGPFILAAAAYIIAGTILFIMLRPDPYLVSKYMRNNHKNDLISPLNNNQKGIMIGAFVMILTQMIMIAIMTMTPIHMQHNGHSLSSIGMVIGIHIGSMYLPSLITGTLVDKIGVTKMSIASAITLLASGILAASAPEHSIIALSIALSLLGIGWNFGLISGTTQIVNSTTPNNRAKIQGKIDIFIALSGATGGAISGMIVANSSYAFLSIWGGILSLILIPIVILQKQK